MDCKLDDSAVADVPATPATLVCRDPEFSLFPCPMLRSGTVTSAHRIAHGAFGGASNIAVKHVVQPVSLGVECPCALCCPCEEHVAMRAEIEAQAEPMAEAEDKQRDDAVQALRHEDAPEAAADADADADDRASKRSKHSGKSKRKPHAEDPSVAAASTAAPATPAAAPSWSQDHPLFAWLTPEAALALAAWDPHAMPGAPHRPLLSEAAGTPPEYDPLFKVSRRPLGSGTFSTVWSVKLKHPPRELPANASERDRATHAYLNGALAIKRFRPITAGRIDSELEIAWRFGLMSPHIPPLLSILRLPGYPVSMVMPQCKHQSFHEVVAPKSKWPRRFQRMSVCQIQAYMRGLLDALSVLHEFNIIHRDVKPDNYLFDFEADGHTGWLVDFGLAHTSSLPHADLRCQQPERKVAVPMEEEAEGSDTVSSIELQSPTPRSTEEEQAQGATAEPDTTDDAPAVAGATASSDRSHKKRSRGASSSHAAGTAAAAAAASGVDLSALSYAAGGAPLVLHRRPRGPEGGTRGYRAPEVLVASLSQGVGVDVWAAGAMLLEIMSRRSPFFQAEKTTGLTEVMALRGVRELNLHGITVQSEGWAAEEQPWSLGQFCAYSSGVQWPAELEELLDSLLQLDPDHRISARAALALPFFQIDWSADPSVTVADADCDGSCGSSDAATAASTDLADRLDLSAESMIEVDQAMLPQAAQADVSPSSASA